MQIPGFGILRLKAIDKLRGTEILKTILMLEEEQYKNRGELIEIANQRWIELFKDAQKGCIYYNGIKKYDDLKVLTKEDIKKNIQKLFSSFYIKPLSKKATGGSTGTPLVYYTTKEAQSYMWACIILSWKVAGYKFGDRVAFLAGSSLFKKDYRHTVFHKLLNIQFYSTFTLDDEKMLEYLNTMEKRKTYIIYGYATALNKMADYINRHQIKKLNHLKGIISTAEVLSKENRENIKKAFGVNVYNQYGCNEAGVSAFECEFNHLHLINTKCKFEIDKENNLIGTDLINRGFLMLRYFTGDKVILSNEESCECGRGYPIIKEVIGRSYDIVVDNNNKIVHAAFFNILFKEDESIRQFQIQFNKKRLTVYLNVTDEKNSNRYSSYMEIIKEHLSFDEYALKINSEFIKLQNAKHRYVINTAA